MRIEQLLNALKNMDTDFLSYVLDTLPIEFSIIDEADSVLFWNQHGVRIFKRGPAIIGRNVRMCHPSSSIHKVEQVIESLRTGKRDHVDFWLDMPIKNEIQKVLVRYYAIRDETGKYLGILETSLNITPLQKITGENRLGDFEP